MFDALFLRMPDPWRVLLTTDHPNGGPFTAYPRLIQLLMDKAERDRVVAGLPELARERSGLAGIEREYSLTEVAIMTGYGSVETAVQAMRLGAYDYITKPFRVEEMKLVLQRMAEKVRLVAENQFVAFRDFVPPAHAFCLPNATRLRLPPHPDAQRRRGQGNHPHDAYGICTGQ